MHAEDIVQDWQRPFYNLAFRMLGNEADAADATQEIFLQIFRNLGQYDPSREFRPWAYRIATNAIYRYLRDRKLRVNKENEVAMNEDRLVEANGPQEHARRREFERLFAQQMSALSAEERSLLLLHYDQGLNQTELAAALDLPRTTVQARLQKALDRLRKNVAGAGLLAAVPELELWMQSTAPITVPSQVSVSLAAMAAQTGAVSTAVTGITIGGILVTKNAILGGVLVGVLALGAGIWTGNALRRDGGAEAAAKLREAQRAEQELVQEREAKKALAERLAQLEDENRKLLAASAAREAMPKMAAVTANEAVLPETAAASTLAVKKTLDWSRFAELLAANIDPMLASFEAEKEDGDDRTSKEDQARLQEVIIEFSKLAQQAKEVSDNPILEPEIAKGLTSAIFEKTLGLSPGQAEALRKAVDHAVTDAKTHLEGPETLPSQYFLARTELLDGITGHLDASVSEAQKDRWSKLSPASQMMLRGDSSISQIGLSVNGGHPETEVANRWQKAFSLNSDQDKSVRSMAPDLVKEAQGILAKYGQTGSNPSNLSRVDRQKMNREFLMAQIRMEKRFAYLLTPEQKKSMASKMPTIFQFAPGGDMNTSRHRGPGF